MNGESDLWSELKNQPEPFRNMDLHANSENGSGPREQMVGAAEAGRLLHCSSITARRLAERGEIPAMRIGNRWMFLPSLLDNWRRQKLLSNCSKS